MASPNTPTIRWLRRRLGDAYGDPDRHTKRSGLDQLICTLLSQNTTDRTSLEAFRLLKKRYSRWEQAAAAPVDDIADTIRMAGLANQKSKRIKEILEILRKRHGRYTIAPVARMPVEEARDYLLGLPGIGAKTAACTMLFSFGMPVFPVDTHIHRVARRLRLIPEETTAEQAHDLLGRIVPDGLCHDLHLLIITHGRRTCHARKPKCAGCVLRARCALGQRVLRS